MNLIKQDVGVWMDVSKGYFPTEVGNYHVRWHMKESTDIDVRPWNNTEVSKNNWKGNVHEWLKPIKQVYVLTEAELMEFADEFIYDETRGEREQTLKKHYGIHS